MGKLIDYNKLDKCVLAFEKLYEELELDLDEQKLIWDILRDRREQKLAKMRSDTYLGDMSGGLLGSIFRKTKKQLKHETGEE
jgi:hypothetical protein